MMISKQAHHMFKYQTNLNCHHYFFNNQITMCTIPFSNCNVAIPSIVIASPCLSLAKILPIIDDITNIQACSNVHYKHSAIHSFPCRTKLWKMVWIGQGSSVDIKAISNSLQNNYKSSRFQIRSMKGNMKTIKNIESKGEMGFREI